MSDQLKELFFQLIALLRIERSQLPIFFFLIVLSSVFWILTVLSKDYTSTISTPVVFYNLPDDKLLIESKEVTLQMQVKAPGFSLLAHQFKFFRKVPLNVSNFMMKRKSDNWEFSWIGAQSLAEVQEALPNKMQLLHVQPNRINLFFGEKSQKSVPISLKSEMSFKDLFRLKGEVQLTPNNLTISGPKSVVDAIESISTEELKLQNITTSQKGKLAISNPSHKELTYNHNEIEYNLSVEQFTEGKLQIPIRIKDVPSDYDIKLFPKNVSVHYVVSLDNFDLVTKELFKCEVTYDSAKKRLPVKLLKSPALAENIRLSPDKVEYILIKK